ncbi:MAG: hypothetical protein IT243_01800 [Bacteroidia bacterium]|nr:hypothetical protein [Bacteroidia bacterium]
MGKIIKSVVYSNFEAIQSIMELYKIEVFDLDCTYSKGAFWKNLPIPIVRSDIEPLDDTILKADSRNLPFENDTLHSIMFDPPFNIGGKNYKNNKEGSSIISKRFGAYASFEELKEHYKSSLIEFNRILAKNGILVFKCQDTVSGGKNHFSHLFVVQTAIELGFYPRDLFVLVANTRINPYGSVWKNQEHARKYHSYFLIFEKKPCRVDYN